MMNRQDFNKKLNKLPNKQRDMLIRLHQHCIDTGYDLGNSYFEGEITIEQREIGKELIRKIGVVK